MNILEFAVMSNLVVSSFTLTIGEFKKILHFEPTQHTIHSFSTTLKGKSTLYTCAPLHGLKRQSANSRRPEWSIVQGWEVARRGVRPGSGADEVEWDLIRGFQFFDSQFGEARTV